MKTKTLTIATASLTLLATGFFADAVQARKMNASFNQVAAMCQATDGKFLWSRSTGTYGCENDNGYIYCQSNGQCEGERDARTRARPTAKMPPARDSSALKNRAIKKSASSNRTNSASSRNMRSVKGGATKDVRAKSRF